MDQGVGTQEYAVVIVDVRERENALEADDVERVLCRHRADAEDIDRIIFLAGIVIQTLQDPQSEIPVHVTDKNADLHADIILT